MFIRQCDITARLTNFCAFNRKFDKIILPACFLTDKSMYFYAVIISYKNIQVSGISLS